MHRRKKFLVYPPNYKPGDGFVIRHSKLQAWKVAVRFGVGASVDVDIQLHPARRKYWTSRQHSWLWGPLTLKAHNTAAQPHKEMA
jgi:hypothetical protein